MNRITPEKITAIKKYFIYFLLYSILGWLYEVFLEVVVYQWGFTNRGVLTGPYCPIYGVGALVFLLCFSKFLRKSCSTPMKIVRPFLIFLGCMAVATIIELSATYILEYFTGSWPWQTYADYAINYQARIALSPSLRFGLGGLLFLYVIQPLFEKLTDKLPPKALNIIFYLLLIIFGIDLIQTLIF